MTGLWQRMRRIVTRGNPDGLTRAERRTQRRIRAARFGASVDRAGPHGLAGDMEHREPERWSGRS